MTRPDVQPLREILHSASKRYLTVRPRGFVLHPGDPPQPTLTVRILGFGSARTLYQNRKPHCRSLDGVQPIDDPAQSCSDCRVRSRCTPQVRLDLFVGHLPFRLLLAWSSAKNFLLYEAGLRQRGHPIEDIVHRIDVINRGSWGELRFSPQLD
jgi:hypothetical protein